MACLLLVLLGISWFLLHAPTQEHVVFLSPSEHKLAISGGRFAPLKQKFQWLIDPILKRFQKAQPDIAISSHLFTLPLTKLDTLGLGPAVTTNTVGVRAWVLSPSQAKALRQTLETTDNFTLVNAPNISVTTEAGREAQIQAVDLKILGGKLLPIGFVLDVLPTRSGASIKMILSTAYTEPSESAPDKSPEINLNFGAACRALIPDGSTLVLAGGKSQGAGTNTYLVITTSQMVDSRGIPISAKP
ncbi:MAG: hypothetical protein JWR26_895 [Pedosphaera sp.]|nr:hypothetical protein [Pedosphaera sp.]